MAFVLMGALSNVVEEKKTIKDDDARGQLLMIEEDNADIQLKLTRTRLD
jgi:hypothetical protein